MKKILASILAIFFLPIIANAQFDLSGLKNVLGGLKEQSDSTSSGSALGGLGDLLSGVLSRDNLEVSDLVGSWKYKSPAVAFKSDNLLKKAGGEAAASAVEKKLAPYYKTTGLDKMVFTVAADSTFTLKLRTLTLTGTIEKITDKNSDYNFTLRFQALRSINLAGVNIYVKKSLTNSMDMMFDVSKLIEIAEKVSSVAKSSAISTAVNVLNSYDGICAGFTLDKTK